jgi:sulfite reductase alpha subunit-like flavoprotein
MASDFKYQAGAQNKAPSFQVLLNSPGENVDGFLSAEFGLCPRAPISSLPADGPHGLWEHAASKLAEMYFSGDYSLLEKLPVLDSTVRCLPDEQLKRAAMLLGIMAHSWAQVGPGGEPPPGILIPWEGVNQRMGRPAATMTYQDYFTLNLCWRSDLTSTPACFTDDNVYKDTDVSVKAFGIDNELFFIQYNFGMDWFSRSMPLDMAKAQQAVLDKEHVVLEEALLRIIRHVESLTEAFTAIDPHPFSPKYCCPVEWSKTIGKIIPSIRKGEQSLSGLQNSSIHLVDIFLGRTIYDSDMGQLAIEERKGWLPSLHLKFFQALSKISVREYVCNHPNRRLRRLYNRLLDAWTGPGEHSWMSKHRIKINNFLELGMKTAREKSSGVSAGEGSDWGNSRAWETVDRYCMEAAHERFDELCIAESWFTPVFLRKVEDMPGNTSRIVFDVAETGLFFEPGDRIKVHPINSPEQVLKCLEALNSSATQKVPLSEEWFHFVVRLGLHDVVELQKMPLHTFLQHATIRPLTLTMACAVMTHMSVDNPHLLAQINGAGGLREYEFWDFLLLCSSLGPRNRVTDLITSLASILPPMEPRQYSISSAETINAHTLEIMVGQLYYSEDDDINLIPSKAEDTLPKPEANLTSDQHCQNLGFGFSSEELDEELLHILSKESSSKAVGSVEPCSPVSPAKALSPSNQQRQRQKRVLHESALAAAVQQTSSKNDSTFFHDHASSLAEAKQSLHAHPAFRGAIGIPQRLRVGSKESSGHKEGTPMQFGVCSTYLRHFGIGCSIQVMVERAEHFHMPADPTVPVVMFGLGTGAAPFRSFVHSGAGCREFWLFWGMKSTEDLFDWQEWATLIIRGQLNLRLALSQDCSALKSHQWPDMPTELEAKRRWHELIAGAETPGRLDKLLERATVKQSLADLMRRGAVFYCCGQPALRELAEEALVGALQDTGLSSIDARQQFFNLIGEHRFKLDLFSSRLLEGQYHRPPISRAEVAKHCHQVDCWVIIDRKVCDLSKYLLQHPGGPKILLDKAGRDCTQDFDRAHGLHNNRVLGMLSPFFIGPLSPPTTSQDSSNRKISIEVVSALVDRLLEAYNVLRADWNRYPELLLPVRPSSSFHRDKETHRRFAGTTLKVMMRALQTSLKSIPGSCEEAVVFSALENAQQAFAMIDPPDQSKLALAIDGDFAFAAKARDGAIALLEDLEASNLKPIQVTQRISALIADLADALGNVVQSFFAAP